MTNSPKTAWKKCAVPAVFLFCILFSLLMVIFRPIPHAHQYGMALKLSLTLAGIWFVYRLRPALVFTRGLRVLVLLVGLGFFVGGIIALKPNAEIVRHYASVFAAIRSGQNPYTCGTIFHRTEFGRPVLGNFNYPPMEIYPYYLLYLVSGTWNIWTLTVFKLALHALACLIFLWTFPRLKRKFLLAFLPLFLFLEMQQNPAMALLLTSLILLAIRKDGESPHSGGRLVIAVLFGVGLMTKFLVIPLMAAYYWHRFEAKRLRSLLMIALEGVIALATAVLIMAPYGVAAVFKETILFNLVLKDRAALTTFYPNVLSGLFSWIRLPGLYPVAAVAILAAAVLAAPRLNVYSAMLTAAVTFLLVAATPRSQFVVIVIYVALVGILANFEDRREVPAEAARSPSPG